MNPSHRHVTIDTARSLGAAGVEMIRAFGEFELDTALLELRCAGNRVHVEPQVFEVLAYLVEHHDRVVPKDELIGHVWPQRFISDAALNSRVMAARRAIGDNGTDQRLIRTIHGRGFRFVGGPPHTTDRLAAPPPGVLGPSPALLIERLAAQQRPSLIGRDAELGRLQQLLSRPGCRLVTIAGPGGVGKTRLAGELSGRLLERGIEVASVHAQPLKQGDELVAAIAAALGLSPATDDPVTEIARKLATRPLVLFIDNVEHIVEQCAETVAALVSFTAALQVVVTSRVVLGLQEEWLFSLGGLALEESPGDSDAARLFLEREARSGAADAEPAGDRPAIDRICRLVDGMPLAIELAASLRRYLTRDEIARRLGEDVDVLRADLRDVPVRHRSIPGLFGESFRRLTVEQMRALLSLSVFEGRFRADDASGVADAPLPVLGELVDRSLLQARSDWFSLHPLLRQFARERLGSAYTELEARHAEYYIRFIVERRERMEGDDQVRASAEIAEQFGNLLAAWRWVCTNGRIDLLSRAAYPAFLFIQLRARYLECRTGLDWAIPAAEAAGEVGEETLAELLVHRAWSHAYTTHGPEVVAAVTRADEILERRGVLPPAGLGTDPLTVHAVIAWAAGRYARGEQYALRAAERARARGDVLGEAYADWLAASNQLRRPVLQWLPSSGGRGGVYRPADGPSQALVEDAERLLAHAASLLRSRGERWFFASVQRERALAAESAGDLAGAIRLYRESHAIKSEFADAIGMGDVFVRLADAYVMDGDADSARSLLAEVGPLVQRVGDRGLETEFVRSRGLVALADGDLSGAARDLGACVSLSIEIGFTNNVLSALRGLGDIMLARGEWETALPMYALVAVHPATFPLIRAHADWSLARIAQSIEGVDVPAALAAARQLDLRTFARTAAERELPRP